MSGKSKRRTWKAKEKMRIVLAGLDGTIEVSELCRREGVSPDPVLRLEEAIAQLGRASLPRPQGEDDREGRPGRERPASRQGRDRGDHGREPGAKKRALGLEDRGQLPPELQQRVHEIVAETKSRSGWPARRTLSALGVARSSYYRWLKEEKWARELPPEPVKPVQVYEATAEEKQKAVDYALKHPAIRHRELAWKMVDENVVCLSSSTVYRTLKERNLVSPWRRRAKRSREEDEKAKRPDERWATDLMYVQVMNRKYYQLNFIDAYSRMIVHHALLPNMEGVTVSLEAQKAIERLLREREGRIPDLGLPEIRSDNGSCYVSLDFRTVLNEHGMSHHRITPHCPEENGLMERANRTIREALEGVELTDLQQARDEIDRLIDWYNHERLHRALGYLRPIDYYRGDPEALQEVRRRKLAAARHARREKNLELRQRTLPLDAGETVT